MAALCAVLAPRGAVSLGALAVVAVAVLALSAAVAKLLA